jgi:serine/threonine protein kinase
MYAMCTGHPPFRAATVFGLLKRICEDVPRPIRSTNPNLPDWLDGFTRKLLAKDPAERFASAGEVAAVLAEELAYLQNPSGTRPPARPWLEQKFATTKWLAASGIGSLLLAATISALLLQRPPALEGEANTAASDENVAASAVDWLTADTSLSQLAAEIDRLEAKSWAVQTTPQFDPWLAEVRALEAALRRVEQGQAESAF